MIGESVAVDPGEGRVLRYRLIGGPQCGSTAGHVRPADAPGPATPPSMIAATDGSGSYMLMRRHPGWLICPPKPAADLHVYVWEPLYNHTA